MNVDYLKADFISSDLFAYPRAVFRRSYVSPDELPLKYKPAGLLFYFCHYFFFTVTPPVFQIESAGTTPRTQDSG